MTGEGVAFVINMLWLEIYPLNYRGNIKDFIGRTIRKITEDINDIFLLLYIATITGVNQDHMYDSKDNGGYDAAMYDVGESEAGYRV